MSRLSAKKALNRLQNDKRYLEKIIKGALITTIEIHGPITKEFIPSATKRITGPLHGELNIILKELETNGD